MQNIHRSKDLSSYLHACGFNASLTATLKVTEWVLKGFALENQLL